MATRPFMHCGNGLQAAHYGAGAGGFVTALLAVALRGLWNRSPVEAPAAASATSSDGQCVCHCHFELPPALAGAPISAWLLIAGLLLGGFAKPLLRAGVRVLAWIARELEGSLAQVRRPKHLPPLRP